jgi:tetratricopeptide (TPR) repeat protein
MGVQSSVPGSGQDTPQARAPSLPPELPRSADIREKLARDGDLTATQVADLLLADQLARWQRGQRVPAEAYLQLHPALTPASPEAFDLVFHEFVLRQDRQEAPSPAEFLWRFPQFAERFQRQLAVHNGLLVEQSTGTPGRADSPGPQIDSGPVPDTPGHEGRRPAVPGYEILAKLGRGGMGVVYQARHLALHRTVALKMIRDLNLVGHEELTRFRAEAEAIARLHHPNIVQIYEVGEQQGQPFFSLEFCPGGSLNQKLESTALPPAEAARLVEQLAAAMQAAHAHNVIHRDLKPANVLLSADGTPKITDFGLAKRLDVPGLTHSNAVLGTPSYKAPEQAGGKGREVGPAADVYALGAILYECLTGRPPFVAATPLDTLAQVLADEPVPVRRLQSNVPRDLETICLRCLEKEPGKRYASAAALAEDLRRFQAGEPIAARPAGPLERALKWVRRRPAVAAAWGLLVVVLTLGAGGGLYWQQQRRAALHRRLQADRDIAGILEQARNLLAEGWEAHDIAKLGQARAEADRAVDIARRGGASPQTQQESADFQAEAAARLHQANKDRRLLDALLDVAAPKESGNYAADESGRMVALAQLSVDEQYAMAFRRWGLDVDRTPEAQVVRRIRQGPAPVVRAVIAGLDAWMVGRRSQKGPDAPWRRLYRLADRLDDHEQRRQLRALVAGKKPDRAQTVAGLVGTRGSWPALWELHPGAPWRALQALRGQLNPGREAVQTVVLLAQANRAVGDAAAAEDVLRQGLAGRPQQVVLLDALGRLLEEQRPARLREAIGCYQAVRAVRPRLGLALAGAHSKAGQAAHGEAVLRDLLSEQPKHPVLWWYVADSLYGQKKLPDAEAAYRKAGELQPDLPAVFNNLGNVLLDQNKLAEAESAYRKAIAIRPRYALAYSNLGNILEKQEKLAEAEATHRRGIALKPDFAEAYNNLGHVLNAQKKLAEAEAAYRKAIALKPDFALAYANLGFTLTQRNKLAEAEAACRRAIALRPDDAGAHAQLGNALRARNKLDEAVAACRKAIELRPEFPEVYNNLGVTLFGQKKLAEAVAAYHKAIALRPDLTEAYYNLGNVLAAQGKLAEAKAAHCKAIDLKPDSAEPYYALGNVLVTQRKPAQAEAAFRKAIDIRPDYPQAYCNLGLALFDQKKLAEAVAAYRKAITLRPDYAVAFINLSNALRDQKKLAEAEATAVKAIALKPDSAEAYNNLSGALRDQEKFAQAEAAARKAIALKPDLAEAYYNLGLALNQQKKPGAAVTAFRNAIALRQDFGEAYNDLGNALRQQRKQDEAVVAYRKAIAYGFGLAHGSLGQILMGQGRFAPARECLHRFLNLLAPDHPLRQPASQLLQQCKQLIALDKRLTAVLKGKAKPKDTVECLQLAWLAWQPYNRQYTAAARLYTEAFTAQPKVADDPQLGHRYIAACVAVLAAGGKGADAIKPDETERARLRAQALGWLRADLAALGKLADGPAPQRKVVREQLAHWQVEVDLASVRDKAALAKLPAAECDAWRKLWADVDDLLKRVTEKK